MIYMMDTQKKVGNGMKVLMFPWLAVGHITPFFELAKKLSQRGFYVYLLSTPINLTFIHNKMNLSSPDSIRLVELHLPESPELPPHRHTTNGLPPHLNLTLQRALRSVEPAFSDVLTTLSPNLLIYDALNPWAAPVAKSHRVPAVRLFTSGAAPCSYFIHSLLREKNAPDGDEEYPFTELGRRLTFHNREMIRAIIQDEGSIVLDGCRDTEDKNVILMTTSREMEGKYIDYMSELLGGCKILPLGALVRLEQDDDDDNHKHRSSQVLMEWLGEKEEKSTVYVSFGSEYFLSDEEIQEVAFGLEESGVNFIWVVRFPKGEEKDLEVALPKGFLGRVGDRGRVVEGWAPQARILSHPNIGGFVSHCGWNSTMESVARGVPIIAMPMQFDQPVNAMLIVEIGVGVEVVRDDRTGRFRREDVTRAVSGVFRGKAGDTIRRNAEVIGENVRIKSLREMDESVAMLAQLCRHLHFKTDTNTPCHTY